MTTKRKGESMDVRTTYHIKDRILSLKMEDIMFCYIRSKGNEWPECRTKNNRQQYYKSD